MKPFTTVKEELLAKIHDRSARVGVVGLGYVGLPLAVEKAKAGFSVVGIDLSDAKAKSINEGKSYILDVQDSELAPLVNAGKLRATTSFDEVSSLDIVVVAVPTPLTRNLSPDLAAVESATREIAKRARQGQLISLESTTYPGTTEEVMLPILEASGLKLEKDFFLVHSPERVDPGNKRFNTKNTQKVVGGASPSSLEIGHAFYSTAIEGIVPVSSARAAELVKVFENTFRSVNVAIVNELALLCDRMNLNVWEVLDAAFTKPFGIMPFYPGPGVGGHCIPIDPHYLEWKAREYNFQMRFVTLAGEINRRMPEFVIEKASRLLSNMEKPLFRSKVLVLGAAYKSDTEDYRESPAIEVISLLKSKGAIPSYHDAFVPAFSEHGLAMESVPLTREVVEGADLVIITTHHSNVDYQWVVDHARHVLDTRNATKKVTANRQKVTLL